MGAMSFSFVDVVVVAVILVSAGFAMWRGFVQESLSIFAWAAAAFASLYFGPSVSALLTGTLSGWAAILAGYASVFLVVVIPLSFLSYRMAESVRHSPVNTLDRTLGMVFGVVRGLAIVGILYLVFSMIVPIPRQPGWMTQARLLPLIQSSGQVILAMIPNQNRHEAAHTRAHPQRAAAAPKARPAAKPRERDAESAHAAKRSKKTYGANERRALDRLIEATASGGTQKP